MGNFNDCMKTLGPNAEELIDFNQLSADMAEFQKLGQDIDTAQRNAIDQQLTFLKQERQSIYNQLPSTQAQGLGAGLKKVDARKKVSDAQEKARAVQATKKAETKTKESDPGPTQTTKKGPTTPEATATIDAGIEAVGRGGRHAAYASDPDSVGNIPPGWKTVPAKDGGVYITPPESEQQVKLWDLADKQDKILGYPNAKPAVGSKTFVVQAKDSKGRVVQDVLTDEAGLDKAIAQGKAAAGPGGSVFQTDAVTAQAQRKAKIEQAKTEKNTTPDGAKTEKLSVTERNRLVNEVEARLAKGESVAGILKQLAKYSDGRKKVMQRLAARANTPSRTGFELINGSLKETMMTMTRKILGVDKIQAVKRARMILAPTKNPLDKDMVGGMNYIADRHGVHFPDHPQFNGLRDVEINSTIADQFFTNVADEGAKAARRGKTEPTPGERDPKNGLKDYTAQVHDGYKIAQLLVGELAEMMGVPAPLVGMQYRNANEMGAAATELGVMWFHIDTLAKLSEMNKNDTSLAATAVQAMAYEVVFHEFGHMTQQSVLKSAPIDEQRAVFQAYEQYLIDSGKRPAFMTEIERLPLAMRMSALTKSAETGKLTSDALTAYTLSASEWWANETAKYIQTGVQEGSVEFKSITNKLARAFKDLYRALKRMFDGAGLPAPAVKEFWDRHRKQTGEFGTFVVPDKAAKGDKSSKGEVYWYTPINQAKVLSEDEANQLLDEAENNGTDSTFEVTMQPAIEVTVKHLATAKLMSQIFGATISKNQDGSRQVSLPEQEANQLQADPTATHHTVVKALSKVFDTGRTEQPGRIEMFNPFTEKNTRASMPEIIRLGYAINVLNDVETSRKNNMMSGLSHMYALGFKPTQVRVKVDGKWTNKEVKGDGALPAGMIVDGRETLGTAVTFEQVMHDKKRPELSREEKKTALAHLQELTDTLEQAIADKADPNFIKQTRGDIRDLKKLLKRTQGELQDELDRKSAILKAMTTGTQQEKNKATLKHKQPVSLLQAEIKDIKQTLSKYFGVKFNDGQFDNREIVGEQEFAGPRVREAQFDAFVAGKPGLDPNDPNKNPDPSNEDTRGLPTEDQQANASARDVTPKKGRSAKYPVLRNNKVTMIAAHLNKSLVNFAGDVLKLLNMNTQVIIVDEAGVQELITQWTEEHQSLDISDPRRIVLRNKIKRMEAILRDPPEGKIDYMDNFLEAPLNPKQEIGVAEDRVPVIFIPGGGKTATQIKKLVHELGHLVQRVMFDQAPKEVQDAIIKTMGGIKASSANNFEENFANMLWRYLVRLEDKAAAESDYIDARPLPIAREVLRNKPSDKADAARKEELKQFQLVKKWFGRLAAKLRQMWEAVGKGFNHPIGYDYEQFVNAMVAVGLQQKGYNGVESSYGKKYQDIVQDLTSGPFLPYNTDVRVAPNSNYSADDVKALGAKLIRDRRAAAAIKATRNTGKNIVNLAQEKILLSADALLRSYKSDIVTGIANAFHHRPGTKKEKGRTWFEENRYWQGQDQIVIDKLIQKLPLKDNKVGWWNQKEVDTTSKEYIQLMEMLHGGATRKDFEALPWVNKRSNNSSDEFLAPSVVSEVGVEVRDYFDAKLAWLNERGVSVKQRQNYMPVVADTALWLQNKGEIMNILRKQMPEEAAERVFNAVTQSEGYLGDIYNDDDAMLGPGFRFMRKRKLDPQTIKALEKYMVTDLSNLMSMYGKMATERGVAQQRWGLNADQKGKSQGEYKSLGIDQHLNSPVAKLHYQLAKALQLGEISPDQYRVIKNKVLEAYFGRLGANIDPRWQKFQTGAIIFQNIRLLSMATLTAFVDAPQLVWRSGDLSMSKKAFGALFNKAKREELYEMAHAIGAIQDAQTAHVLNDEATTRFMSANAKNMNEKFFRFIGMHQWTNMVRVAGMELGKRFLERHAMLATRKGHKDNDAKKAESIRHLEELGVTAEEVLAWSDAGYPVNNLDGNSAHGRVISALNTFIDEGVVRPDASVRPAWASDRNFQVFFHLKSFLWGYHEVIWRRVAERAKAQPNFQKMLMQGGMSALMLAMVTLPFAALGYELRRLLGWWGNPPAGNTKYGLDYMGELAERAGWLGLLQFVADADQAESFGRSSTLSLLGPTVSQLEGFWRDSWENSVTKSVPFMAQSGAARAIFRDALQGN